MKVSLVRRFVALAALAVCSLAAQAHAATLAFEALYDPANGNISIRPFDSDTGNPWVGTAEFAFFDFQSTAGVFTGAAPNFDPAQATVDTDTRVSNAILFGSDFMEASSAAPYNVGNIAATGLTQGFIDTDFFSDSSSTPKTPGTFLYSLGLGTPNTIGSVTVTAVPEPSTIVTLAIGGIAGLGYTARRKLRKKAA